MPSRASISELEECPAESDPTPEEVSRAASLLSKLGAAKGGQARAASTSQHQRKLIASKAARTRWSKRPEADK